MNDLASQIKDALTCADFLASRGYAVRGGRTQAKWRGGKGFNVALFTSRDGVSMWSDHVGGDSGSVIDLAMKIDGVTIGDALKRLAEMSNINPASVSIQSRRPKAPPPPTFTAEELAARRRALLPKAARDFVPVTLRGLGAGATTADLVEMSPARIPATYGEQAALQLKTLGADWRYFTWAGTIVKGDLADRLGRKKKSPYLFCDSTTGEEFKRRCRGIYRPETLAHHLATNTPTAANFPTHISLNPQTGRTDTGVTYDGDATVAIYRHALLEFDELKTDDGLPDKNAVEIVVGLVKWSAAHDGAYKPLVAVWTGGKSIHTVVRIAEHPRRIPGTAEYDPLTTDVPDDEDRAFYAAERQCLLELFASADDARFRIDSSACTTNHPRLAGGVHLGTGKRARLLYAAPPDLDLDMLF